jgi:hypothetical protein
MNAAMTLNINSKSQLKSTTAYYLVKKLAKQICLNDNSQDQIEIKKKLKESKLRFSSYLSTLNQRKNDTKLNWTLTGFSHTNT